MTHARELFARHGLRCTPQRETIYAALVATKAHPTAEELFQQVRTRLPGVSLATVYNTLEALTRRGLARRFNNPHEPEGPARFDADTSPHVHVISDDGRIRDVPEDLGDRLMSSLPPALLDELEARLGVRVDRVNIELHGAPVDGGRC